MPGKGEEAVVFRIPMCDIHKYDLGVDDVPAVYDAKTRRGPWAYMCQGCFDAHSLRRLGTGYGQRLVLKET